jgi:hypothetical protein
MSSVRHTVRFGAVNSSTSDSVPQRAAIAPHAVQIMLHSFDSRVTGWDLNADIRSPEVAIEILSALVPSTHESQPFFSDAARHLMYAVMNSLDGTPRRRPSGSLSGDEARRSASHLNRPKSRPPKSRRPS